MMENPVRMILKSTGRMRNADHREVGLTEQTSLEEEEQEMLVPSTSSLVHNGRQSHKGFDLALVEGREGVGRKILQEELEGLRPSPPSREEEKLRRRVATVPEDGEVSLGGIERQVKESERNKEGGKDLAGEGEEGGFERADPLQRLQLQLVHERLKGEPEITEERIGLEEGKNHGKRGRDGPGRNSTVAFTAAGKKQIKSRRFER